MNANFPSLRLRRLRGNEMIRSLVKETNLSVKDFVYPMFVVPGRGVKQEIVSMPGQFRFSVDKLVEECKLVRDLGIPAIMLFGVPDHKDATGTSSFDDNGIVQLSLRVLAKEVPELLTIADVCLCAYTDHGHCGIIENGHIHNDKTLEVLRKQSLSFAQAGAGMIAPSDMMDGRIAAIRDILDDNNFENIPIMAYSAKFASGFYGPFRDAAHSAPQFGDRKTYQMEPANGKEALREIELDIQEGADIVMVKPALAYLDIIQRASERYDLPIAAYNVSGEYAMIKAAAQNGWIDHDRVMMETLTSIKRAGAKIILTYFAKEASKIIC